eukprot:jgi/Chlat1/5205/Chrsp33S00394
MPHITLGGPASREVAVCSSSSSSSIKRVHIYADAEHAAHAASAIIADILNRTKNSPSGCSLGLATGNSPIHVYDELVRLHKYGAVSFSHARTFNLDEYYPIPHSSPQSYHSFMRAHLFERVDLDPARAHVPDGEVGAKEVDEYCREYERKVVEVGGGVDVQILGIGRTGHVGFNEPGSARDSVTRLVRLDKVTRVDAASDFFGEANVPKHAITMGMGTIMRAKKIILLAFGENKAAIIKRALEGPVTPDIPASFLQTHPDVTVLLDDAASSSLTSVATPWLVPGLASSLDWRSAGKGSDASASLLEAKAVTWLAKQRGKGIMRLDEDDYLEAGLGDLVDCYPSAAALNADVFQRLSATITTSPGTFNPPDTQGGDKGKLTADGLHVSAVSGVSTTSSSDPRRVLVLSPHPDDDVISMGGTLANLANTQHDNNNNNIEVHVAYQTSGCIAVHDHDALRYARFADAWDRETAMVGEATQDQRKGVPSLAQEAVKTVQTALANKAPAQVDALVVQRLKTLIREEEARSAARSCGVRDGNMHFLNMPFYETGAVVKKPLSEEDVNIVVDLFERIRPYQIYAAGDLSDPHGTHRTCLAAILRALRIVSQRAWFTAQHTRVYLYRGAWQEWEAYEASMAVPMDAVAMSRKTAGIWHHQSQKDPAPFPGSDPREFWQRARARNGHTADVYRGMGLGDWEGMELFVELRLE